MIDNLFGTAFDWPLASALSLSLLVVLFAFATGFVTILLRFDGARAVLQRGTR
jgi:spermidine/putrescine transport system permease protein